MDSDDLPLVIIMFVLLQYMTKGRSSESIYWRRTNNIMTKGRSSESIYWRRTNNIMIKGR
jgi:hypothetical protein